MQHRGTRSRKKRRERYKKWIYEKYEDPWHKLKRINVDLPRGIVLNFSQKDLINGEIIYTVETEGIVNGKLAEYYSDDKKIPDWLLNHEFGDVLNRFPIIPVRAEGLAI